MIERRQIFYRYIRPVHFNSARVEIDTNPYGGICLRFEELNDALWFVHSRCTMNELFSKDVAKHVVDQRALTIKEMNFHEKGYCGRFPITKNTAQLSQAVQTWCESWVPTVKEATVLYHAFDLKELSTMLDLIKFNNIQQEDLAKHWRAAIEAAHYGEKYSNHKP